MTRREYAGGAAATTITTPIASSGGGTVTLGTSVGWPTGAVGKFHVVVDPGTSAEEKILVDLRSGTTLSFSAGGRGADGTVSTSHVAGALIWLCYTALDADEANDHINKVAGAHAAAAIAFTPAGNISATTVQTAIAEVDAEADVRLDALETASTTYATFDGRLDAIEANDYVTAPRIATAKFTRTTAATVNSTPNAAIVWEGEDSDPDNMVSNATGIVTVSKAGTFIIGGTFTITGTINSPLTVLLKKNATNGTNTTCALGLNAGSTQATYGTTMYFDAGDTFIIHMTVASSSISVTNVSLEMTRFAA